MKQPIELVKLKRFLTFPVAFELLIWGLYACLYKYSLYLNSMSISTSSDNNFPYPSQMVYAIASTLYLVPLYRLIVPYLLDKKKYGWLGVVTILYLAFLSKVNNLLVSYLFLKLTPFAELSQFYESQFSIALQQSKHILKGWNLQLLLFDFLAFGCIAFVRYAFQSEQKRMQSEQRRHQLEKDNLAMQLHMLKTQLQPHFLFNTLNSMYGLSLSGSKDTPRFILLLSEMMRYILYETDKKFMPLEQEVRFLNNYFELEQKKFPTANIAFEHAIEKGDVLIPPLLFLPLVENSFKHGSHRITDDASVHATVLVEENTIRFKIKNNTYKFPAAAKVVGGIGLENLRKRLELYYPMRHTFTATEEETTFTTELVLKTN